MTDLTARLRDADTTRRIGESYADTHERRQRDREEAAARIQQLEAALRVAAHELELLYFFARSNGIAEAGIPPHVEARAALENTQ